MAFLQKVFRRNDGYSPPAAATESDLYTKGYRIVVTYLGYEDLPNFTQSSASDQARPIVDRFFLNHDELTKNGPMVATVTATAFQLAKESSGERLAHVKLYRIAHIGTSAEHRTAFWMIERAQDGSGVSCHVFKCKTPEAASALTAVTAKAFQNAFKTWDSKRAKSTVPANAESAVADTSADRSTSDESSGNEGSVSDLTGFFDAERKKSETEEAVFARRMSKSSRPDLILDVTQSKVAGDALRLSFGDFLKFVQSVEEEDDPTD